jgi:hypothetical protein
MALGNKSPGDKLEMMNTRVISAMSHFERFQGAQQYHKETPAKAMI